MMDTKKKIDFLRHLLRNESGSNGVERLLSLLIDDPSTVANLHFVDEMPEEETPKYLVMRFEGARTRGSSLMMYVNGTRDTRVYEIADKLISSTTPIYVFMDFGGSMKDLYFLDVVETNPHKDELVSSPEADNMMMELEVEGIKLAIDRALDNNNQELFMELTNKLKERGQTDEVSSIL